MLTAEDLALISAKEFTAQSHVPQSPSRRWFARLLVAGTIAVAFAVGHGDIGISKVVPQVAPIVQIATSVAQPQLPATQAPVPAMAQVEAQAQAQYDAFVKAQEAQGVQQPAPVQPLVSTAVVNIPTAVPIEQVTVVPRGMPALAPGSDMRPTPITVLPYPTPLPAAIANNYQLSPDGKCVIAPRDGKRYQVCQDFKYQPNEVTSVADYIRTGLLPGVEVKE